MEKKKDTSKLSVDELEVLIQKEMGELEQLQASVTNNQTRDKSKKRVPEKVQAVECEEVVAIVKPKNKRRGSKEVPPPLHQQQQPVFETAPSEKADSNSKADDKQQKFRFGKPASDPPRSATPTQQAEKRSHSRSLTGTNETTGMMQPILSSKITKSLAMSVDLSLSNISQSQAVASRTNRELSSSQFEPSLSVVSNKQQKSSRYNDEKQILTGGAAISSFGVTQKEAKNKSPKINVNAKNNDSKSPKPAVEKKKVEPKTEAPEKPPQKAATPRQQIKAPTKSQDKLKAQPQQAAKPQPQPASQTQITATTAISTTKPEQKHDQNFSSNQNAMLAPVQKLADKLKKSYGDIYRSSVSPSPTPSQKVNKTKKPDGSTHKEYGKDLYSKLEDLNTYHENIERLSKPNPPSMAERIAKEAEQAQQRAEMLAHQAKLQTRMYEEDKENIRSNPNVQIQECTYNSQKTTVNFGKETSEPKSYFPKPDLAKISQPKHKKKAVELIDHCSFQPMLAKKSLEIANRLGESKERLYNNKTPSKSKGASPLPTATTHNDLPFQMQYSSFGAPTFQAHHAVQQNQHSSVIPVEKEEFHPKICEKSRQIDEHRKRQIALPRHEVLTEIGQEYSMRKKRMQRSKEREEEEKLKALEFKPTISKPPVNPYLHKSVVDANVVDRNEQWVQRKIEKIEKLKTQLDQKETAKCSFTPVTNKKCEVVAETSDFCGSQFVTEGIKSYFTRLEVARRMKKEAQDRLEHWGRSKASCSPSPRMKQSTREYPNVHRSRNATPTRPQWESASHSAYGSDKGAAEKECFSNNILKEIAGNSDDEFDGQSSQNVAKTLQILKENLKKIQIHLH